MDERFLTKLYYNDIVSQWRRQRSKGARSFRGQKILKPGHPVSGA